MPVSIGNVCLCMYACICVWIYACIYVCVCMYASLCRCMPVLYMCPYICMHGACHILSVVRGQLRNQFSPLTI